MTGARLKDLRIQRGFTLKDVADFIGVTEATVQRYESGSVKRIPYERLEALSALYDCNPGYLTGWEDGHSVVLSPSERLIIDAYRKAPEGRRDAVRALLGL